MKSVIVIGCGKFGYYHAQKYAAMEGIDLTCIVDTDRKRVKEVAGEFECQFTDDYKNIDTVDLVSIATPNNTHYDIAKYFIERGADVLIEKPMTESGLELQDLIVKAKFKGVRLWGGFLERYNSIFKQVTDEKVIQELYAHRSCSYRECRENEDVVFDLMIHDIFLVSLLINSEIKDLEVERRNSLSNCNDFVRAKIRFANGSKADLTARRDIEDKTKLFCVKTKNARWEIYNLKKKNNDTLADQLRDFVVGSHFDTGLALKSMRMAERILE